MQENIQDIKAKKKINLLKNHIIGLSEYNSIENYNNIKRFKVNIDYYRSFNYYYYIYITRGTNNPEKTFNLRLQTTNKLNNLLSDLIKTILNDKIIVTHHL